MELWAFPGFSLLRITATLRGATQTRRTLIRVKLFQCLFVEYSERHVLTSKVTLPNLNLNIRPHVGHLQVSSKSLINNSFMVLQQVSSILAETPDSLLSSQIVSIFGSISPLFIRIL